MVDIRRLTSAYRNGILSLICFSLLLIVTGCQVTTTVHFYDGPQLSNDQVAKVILEKREKTFSLRHLSSHAHSIHIKTIDGKDPSDFGEGTVVPLEVFILPGEHVFDVQFRGR